MSRVRFDRSAGLAATFLFVALATVWLVALWTAQVGAISTPLRYRAPSLVPLAAARAIATAGVVLVFTSVIWNVWSFVSLASVKAWGRVVVALMAGFVASALEVTILVLVSHHALATAPLGAENSGEGAAAIVVLGLAQIVLVCPLALAHAAVLPRSQSAVALSAHRRVDVLGSSLLGLAGVLVACGAFAFWSVFDGTTYLVNTRLIANFGQVANVGGWWPGMFAALATLMVFGVTMFVVAIAGNRVITLADNRRRLDRVCLDSNLAVRANELGFGKLPARFDDARFGRA